MDTRIYVITHKEYNEINQDGYISLQVGCSLNNDLGYVSDNSGDNISHKNKNYSELTGVYWIWKNIRCDIVGICHYRRFFEKNHQILSKEYIEDILATYDAITLPSGLTPSNNVWEHYCNCHYKKDMQIVRDIIEEKYPDFIMPFDLSMQCNLISMANMIITKKDIFDEYCQWLFDILFEAENRIDLSGYDDVQKRIFGFISERLLRVWLLGKKLKIKEENLLKVDEEKYQIEQLIIDKKYHLFEVILQNLISNYKEKNYIDYADNSALTVDFSGHVPVWVCWWQGVDEAPEIVRICIESIQKNIPSNAQLHLITMDNVGDYITLPQWIIDRYCNGQLNNTHLSDILRFGLLYRYGGLWLDATYLLTKPIPDYILNSTSVYSTHMKKPTWWHDIAQGRWTSNLIGGPANHLFFRYMLNGLYMYWQLSEAAIDYELTDYIMTVGYNNLDFVKQTIDSIALDQPEILSLRQVLNHKFDQEQYDIITSDTSFFKMNRRDELTKFTIADEDTFWGYICKHI